MKQKMQRGALLDEAAQLKIYGGVSSSTNSHIKIYIKDCSKTWGDCKSYCGAKPL